MGLKQILLVTGSILTLGLGSCVNSLDVAVPEVSKDSIYNTVPEARKFSRTAYQLTGEELEKLNGFYSSIKRLTGKDVARENPLIISGKIFEGLTSKDPGVNALDFEGVGWLGSSFYNSKGYSLEDKKGIFVSQSEYVPDKNILDRRNEFHKGRYNKNSKICVVGLTKDNIGMGINMYVPSIKATEEFSELVNYVKSKGFQEFLRTDVCDK